MFGQQAMRLLREKWSSINMLAEEIFSIFQDDIPLSHSAPVTITVNSDEAPLTVRQFGNGPFMKFTGRGGQINLISADGFLTDENGKKKCGCRHA